jgi:hypothetical protein
VSLTDIHFPHFVNSAEPKHAGSTQMKNLLKTLKFILSFGILWPIAEVLWRIPWRPMGYLRGPILILILAGLMHRFKPTKHAEPSQPAT